MNMARQPIGQELERRRLIELLRNLTGLEHLELGGECGAILWFCRGISEETTSVHIRSLIVRRGEHERDQAFSLKHLADAAGLTPTLICVPYPAAREESEEEMDTSGSG